MATMTRLMGDVAVEDEDRPQVFGVAIRERAQMIETDPTWRDLIMRERIRVENELEERLKG